MYRSLVVACALWSLAPRASAQPAPAPSAAPAPAVAADVPAIEVTATRVEVNREPAISTDLLFEPGDVVIKPSARPLLDAIARALAKDLTTSVRIACHTDDTAPDSDRSGGYNQKLSQARADAVLAYLGKRGVAARRLSAKGHGRDKPIAENTGDDGRRANRRLELAIVGEVRPPEAADLATYTRALKGKGSLIATIATNLGTLHCELFDDKAPIAVANFIGLATGQKPWTEPQTGKTMRNKPFYNGLVFHRVIPRFMIQGGDPLGNGTGGPGYKFDDEIDAEVSHKPGTLAMANAGPGTNGSQFFIDEIDAPWLDKRHTVLGQCKELDVVTKIASVPRGAADKPTAPVMITRITIARGTP
jgi:cyclophilin family peptidyl-prolyl cis-trans isomerase/outer membrane protein OmpA-like peptidoglycan-associated protein